MAISGSVIARSSWSSCGSSCHRSTRPVKRLRATLRTAVSLVFRFKDVPMSTGSIEIDYRVSLPSGSFRWINHEPEGWTCARDRGECPDLPWLLRDPEPDAIASPDHERVMDRSSGRLYRDFLRLAKHSPSTKEAFGDAVVRFATRYGFLADPCPLD